MAKGLVMMMEVVSASLGGSGQEKWQMRGKMALGSSAHFCSVRIHSLYLSVKPPEDHYLSPK